MEFYLEQVASPSEIQTQLTLKWYQQGRAKALFPVSSIHIPLVNRPPHQQTMCSDLNLAKENYF